MASLIREKARTFRIEFTARKKRLRVRLGAIPKRTAEAIRLRVELLVAAKAANTALDTETAAWLGELGDELHGRLVRAGIATKRAEVNVTLEGYLNAYISSKKDVSGATRLTYEHGKSNLIDFFGPQKPLRDITSGDAEEYRDHLASLYSDATCRRRVALAKQFFERATKKQLLSTNPFGDIKGLAVRANQERQFVVTEEMIQKLMPVLPSAEWKLAVAMARYGGVRIPSEILTLNWLDVDWPGKKIRITSPKTATKGKTHRYIPLWESIRPYLLTCQKGATSNGLVFEQLNKLGKKTRHDTNTHGLNLRTQLIRFIERAGLKVWEKPWQNMRATRATELVHKHPAHLVNAWLGHTEAVALSHYRQVLESDYQNAVALESRKGDSDEVTILDKQAARNAARPTTVIDGKLNPSSFKAPPMTPKLLQMTVHDNACTYVQVGPV